MDAALNRRSWCNCPRGAIDWVGNRSPRRRRFALAHELGHHLLRHSATFSVDLADAGGTRGGSPTYNWRHERAAERLRSELPMPAALVRTVH